MIFTRFDGFFVVLSCRRGDLKSIERSRSIVVGKKMGRGEISRLGGKRARSEGGYKRSGIIFVRYLLQLHNVEARNLKVNRKMKKWDKINFFRNISILRYIKGRVSRFGACASDNVSAVKPIVFGPIRSEYTTPAGYGGLVL